MRTGKGYGENEKFHHYKGSAPYPAISKALLQQYLRKEYDIQIEVTFHMDGYAATVYDMRNGIAGCLVYEEQMTIKEKREFRGTKYNHITYIEDWFTDHKTYEEALEVGLIDSLKLINNDKVSKV